MPASTTSDPPMRSGEIGHAHTVEDLEIGAHQRRRRGAGDVAAPGAVVFDVRVVGADRVPRRADVAAVAAGRDRGVRELDADGGRPRIGEVHLQIGAVVLSARRPTARSDSAPASRAGGCRAAAGRRRSRPTCPSRTAPFGLRPRPIVARTKVGTCWPMHRPRRLRPSPSLSNSHRSCSDPIIVRAGASRSAQPVARAVAARPDSIATAACRARSDRSGCRTAAAGTAACGCPSGSAPARSGIVS